MTQDKLKIIENIRNINKSEPYNIAILGDLQGPKLRVGEIEAAYARTGPHGKRLGDHHPGVRLHVEQTPERAFLRVVRAGWVTCGRPDPSILLLDEIGGA